MRIPLALWSVAGILIPACGSSSDTSQRAAPSTVVPPATACARPVDARIRELVSHLNDNADELHSVYTPSVHALIGEGISGACAVLERLMSDDGTTRLRASRVIEGVLSHHYGFQAGFGYPSEYGEEQVRTTLRSIGYTHDASRERRREAMLRWRRWLEEDAQETPANPTDGPSVAEMQSALTGVFANLEQCGHPVDLVVTFSSSGNVTSIHRGADTSARDRTCLNAAVENVRVAPFQRTSVWIHYSSETLPWRTTVKRSCDEYFQVDNLDVRGTSYATCGAEFDLQTHRYLRETRQNPDTDVRSGSPTESLQPFAVAEAQAIRFCVAPDNTLARLPEVGGGAPILCTRRQVGLPAAFIGRDRNFLEILSVHPRGGILIGMPDKRDDDFAANAQVFVLAPNSSTWESVYGPVRAIWLDDNRLVGRTVASGYVVVERSRTASSRYVASISNAIDSNRQEIASIPSGYLRGSLVDRGWSVAGDSALMLANDIAYFQPRGSGFQSVHIQRSDRDEFTGYPDDGAWGQAVAARYIRNGAERWARVFQVNGARVLQGHWYIGGCERFHVYLEVREHADFLEHRWVYADRPQRGERMMRDWFVRAPNDATVVLRDDGHYPGDPSIGSTR